MLRSTLYLLCTPLLVTAALPAQGNSPFVEAKTADAIEAAYKRVSPYSDLKWQRFDRPPFVLFIEEQDRGSLLGLANQRAMPLLAAAEVFEKRFAEPLGLKARPRPLPVWILKSRESYTKIGGSEFSGAHFNLLHEHTVTYYDRSQDLRKAFHTLMHEVVHQVMFRYTDPSRPLHLNFMSTWYMEGMAEHFATRERGPMIQGKDPGFGAIDESRIEEVRQFVRRSFNWKRRKRMPFIHHPMGVMVYNTLPSYFSAVGITQNEKEDYASQMGFFYRSSHSIVAFLDLAYRGVFRNRLLEITKLEYAGRRGAATINQVFRPNEQVAFKALYDGFVLDPSGVAEKELPAQYAHLKKISDEPGPSAAGAAGPTGAAAGLFPEPGDERVPELPKAGEVPKSGKVAAALALGHLQDLAFAKARKVLEGVDGSAAEKIQTALTALEGAMSDFKKYIQDNPSKARIYLPNPANPNRYQAWRFRAYRDLENVFQLVRNGNERLVRPAEIPAVLFGEAVARLDLVKTPERRKAFGILVSASVRDLDESDRGRVLRRAKRADLEPDDELVDELGAVLAVAGAIESAKVAMLTSDKPEAVLADLLRVVNPHRDDPEVKKLVAAAKGELIEKAFERSSGWLSSYRGKAELLPGGRVRLTYDWSSKGHGIDWRKVDPKKDGFTMMARRPESADFSGRYEIDTSNKQLHVYGALYLRHRMQFEGDVSIRWQIPLIDVQTDEGLQKAPSPTGWMAINALRPGSYLAATWVQLFGFEQGSSFVVRKVEREKLREVSRPLFGEGKMIELERKGDLVSLRVGDQVLATAPGRKLPALGAAMILVSEWMVPEGAAANGKAPSARIGQVQIEGKPAAVSLAAERARFYSEWLRRLP